MKKLFFTLIALLLSSVVMAGSLVKISYSNQAELEKLFADPNLIIHHYSNTDVYATAEKFDANTMVMIDENAFQDCEVYTLLYGGSEPVVVKGPAMPLKNDGAVAIFNKRARLPQRNRDFPVVTEENNIIREMMEQVNMDSLEGTVQHLQDYQNRMWNSDNAFNVSDWIASRMAALGLEVEQQPFYANTWTGSGQAAPNVIGIQRGTLYPNTYVVCGSHFDSFSYEAMSGSGTCPGADDNATGVASVLESARIMTQYDFEYSIIYCAFGCEEMGLYGSEAYASRCQQEGMDIIGYFNNDMNGYLWGDVIHIDCIYPESVAPIGNYYMNVANIYFPEMPVQHVDLTYGDSDHTSFNNHGYMGIYPFEDVEHESPYIHTPNDLIGPSVTSFAMSQRYCQMNIGCLAEIATLAGETPMVECNPVQNFHLEYPNPGREMSHVALVWEAPLEGSTGTCQKYEVYRNGSFHATVEHGNYALFGYNDTIEVGEHVDYFVKTVYDDGCEADSETLEAIGVSDNVNEFANKVAVYPNPVEDQLTIEAEDLQRVVIYNQLGQQIASIDKIQSNLTLSVESFLPGVYFLQIISNNGTTINKTIVKL
ncbi:MAG: M28 family peptidase [Bacteroidales bacterium]|nr:M28 family peptidase [Bacteroidales bacterium]